MDTKTKLSNNLKDAMRAKDDLRKRTIRLAMAAIKITEIDQKSALEETAVMAILQKEVKMRRETIEGAEQASRQDLISEAKAEIAVLEEFLPAPFSSQELKELAQNVIEEVKAVSPRDMGKVMQLLMPQVLGRADGKAVSLLVKQLLSG